MPSNPDPLHKLTCKFLVGEMIHLSASGNDINEPGVKKFLKGETDRRVMYLKQHWSHIVLLAEMIEEYDNDGDDDHQDKIYELVEKVYKVLSWPSSGGLDADGMGKAVERLKKFLKEAVEVV